MNQLDTLAAAYAEEGDFQNAVKWENKVLESLNLAPEDIAIVRQRLALYQATSLTIAKESPLPQVINENITTPQRISGGSHRHRNLFSFVCFR
jgi:hypothetical protein